MRGGPHVLGRAGGSVPRLSIRVRLDRLARDEIRGISSDATVPSRVCPSLTPHAPTRRPSPAACAGGATGPRVPRRQPGAGTPGPGDLGCGPPWEPRRAPWDLTGPWVALRHPRRRFASRVLCLALHLTGSRSRLEPIRRSPRSAIADTSLETVASGPPGPRAIRRLLPGAGCCHVNGESHSRPVAGKASAGCHGAEGAGISAACDRARIVNLRPSSTGARAVASSGAQTRRRRVHFALGHR